MKTFKTFILVISLFCLAQPLNAMDPTDGMSFFDKACGFLQKHSGTALLAAYVTAVAAASYKCYSDNKFETEARVSTLDEMKALVKNPAYVKRTELFGLSALHFAAREGQTEKVKLLLEHGANIIGDKSYSILTAAIANNHLETGRSIVLHYANADVHHVLEKHVEQQFMQTLAVFRTLNIPKDVRICIMSHLPELVRNKKHCHVIGNAGADLATLVSRCPVQWLKEFYDQLSKKEAKADFLERVLPLLVKKRLDRVSEFLLLSNIQALKVNQVIPAVVANVDLVSNVESYQQAIEQNIQDLFNS